MSKTLSDLTRLSGVQVLDHLEQEVAVPVIADLQAQGDLIVIPHDLVRDDVVLPPDHGWRDVPPEGLDLLRSAAGGNPHCLVAEPGTCRWVTHIRDGSGLSLGALTTTRPAYLIHPEHGGSGLAPGTYVVRRQREGTGDVRLPRSFNRRRLGARLVAD
ncbi:hypothetical protein J4H86_18545 [Spiractinospora alimapuensis]|uniref:hypothetical protein n=1 Tax=Spiractinospora alimapuensis TaxID=2820884 RepID=UPI001F46D6E3|nr:hypothetical protein [Spiractinospora alimapuensis]QVQ50849.1 hypothetical protein J4H86_18545 [Spiractinospora alimapuensis]